LWLSSKKDDALDDWDASERMLSARFINFRSNGRFPSFGGVFLLKSASTGNMKQKIF
jgi:hypothetical protein